MSRIDEMIKADRNIFQAIFPEQTKTPLRIVIWSVIFFVDLILCVVAGVQFGILRLEGMNEVIIGVILVVALVIFWLEGFLWGKITQGFRKEE